MFRRVFTIALMASALTAGALAMSLATSTAVRGAPSRP